MNMLNFSIASTYKTCKVNLKRILGQSKTKQKKLVAWIE